METDNKSLGEISIKNRDISPLGEIMSEIKKCSNIEGLYKYLMTITDHSLFYRVASDVVDKHVSKGKSIDYLLWFIIQLDKPAYIVKHRNLLIYIINRYIIYVSKDIRQLHKTISVDKEGKIFTSNLISNLIRTVLTSNPNALPTILISSYKRVQGKITCGAQILCNNVIDELNSLYYTKKITDSKLLDIIKILHSKNIYTNKGDGLMACVSYDKMESVGKSIAETVLNNRIIIAEKLGPIPLDYISVTSYLWRHRSLLDKIGVVAPVSIASNLIKSSKTKLEIFKEYCKDTIIVVDGKRPRLESNTDDSSEPPRKITKLYCESQIDSLSDLGNKFKIRNSRTLTDVLSTFENDDYGVAKENMIYSAILTMSEKEFIKVLDSKTYDEARKIVQALASLVDIEHCDTYKDIIIEYDATYLLSDDIKEIYKSEHITTKSALKVVDPITTPE